MDIEKIKAFVSKGFAKEKSLKVIIALGICGIALIYLSSLTGAEKTTANVEASPSVQLSCEEYAHQLEQSLAKTVTAITGEETPTVLVTLEGGVKTIYATDEKTDTQQTETTHVILKDSSGAQQALTVVNLQPEVKGVVVVCSAAQSPTVKEKLTEAVKTALNISSTRVCVTCG